MEYIVNFVVFYYLFVFFVVGDIKLLILATNAWIFFDKITGYDLVGTEFPD